LSTLIAVAKNRFVKGFAAPGDHPPLAFEVAELRAALERTYTTDAHLVTYVVAGAERQPRINKGGLPYFDGRVETTCFFCDVDNPGHAEWTDDYLSAAMDQYASVDVLQTAGVYHTAHGRRIVQPLLAPIAVAQVEPYIRRWLLSLEQAGISVDWSCKDWTRHFRLPHVHRQGRPFRSPYLNLDRMRPIALEPIVDLPPAEVLANAGKRKPRVEGPLAWSTDIPDQWEERCVHLAKAVRETVGESWHDMYLALGGALLSRRLPPEHLPSVIRWIATAASSAKPEGHERSARDTARRFADGLPTSGYRRLRERWPGVAEALDRVTATRIEARLREQARVEVDVPAIKDATRQLEEAIRSAPDGLTVISAECGMGKTRVAIDVAVERAQKKHASPNAAGTRAPLQSKTSISVDKNALAIQVAEDIRGKGASVRRVFGPLSVMREDGTPECRYHKIALPLVEGGQPMQWELCQGRDFEKCEFYGECAARDGVEGPADARITIGPHALLAQLDGAAGSTGLLVIDEPPALLETVVLTTADLEAARMRLDAFEGQFAAAMAPVLDTFATWLAIGDEHAAVTPERIVELAPSRQDLLDAARRAVGKAEADLFACAELAISEEKRSQAPPLRRADVFNAKRNAAFAIELGTASRVLGTLRVALTSTSPVTVRVEERGATHALHVTRARPELGGALTREGAVVVTDANADLHLPVYTKVVGYKPRLHKFRAADGAPIQRTLMRCASATRNGWLAHGRLVLDTGFLGAVRAAFDWARKDPATRKLGIITMRVTRILLEAIQRPEDAGLVEQWLDMGQTKKTLQRAREELETVLRTWPGEIAWGHYGAVRGLNAMADADAIISLGDPWPNVGEVENEIAFLGLSVTKEERLEALCKAELEQAHGRLRAIHRTRSGRALHVGTVLPGGTGWTGDRVLFERMPNGYDAPARAMDLAELHLTINQLGGVNAVARLLNVSHTSVSRYSRGERPISLAVASRLRHLTQQAAAE
jgi:hypothetical protein